MGRYADDLKKAQAEGIPNDLLNKETENDKIESLKEVLNLLSQVDDGNTKIGGVINDAADARITAALGENGAITTAIANAITAALGENGSITTAISGAITTAIGENGSIETWGDGRYTKKTE